MANLTPIYVRAANPIWFMHDLTGNILDDTYYAHFLTNDLPYVPQAPFDSPFATANPWTGGIVQFAANGALPNNLFFDDSLTYRIEIRQGDSQADPLIYTIENFVPGGEGGGGTGDINMVSDNLITNPQFVETLFHESYSETGSDFTINAAPGWDIVTTGGSGTVDISLQVVTADENIPGQAPQFLRVTTSGSFTSVRLKQRFEDNGGLFFSTDSQQRAVSCFAAAKTTSGTPEISAVLRSSSDNDDVTLFTVSLNTTWNPFTGGSSDFLPESTNTDDNEDAWVDFDIDLPTTGTVDITSLQIISQTNLQQPAFEQESLERQEDHIWHFYRDEVVIKPKDTILTGWNFPLNPFQFITTLVTATSSAAEYIADQTIIWQADGAGVIKTGVSTAATRTALQLTANSGAGSNNKFALIQYIDPSTTLAYWSYFVSSLVRARLSTSHDTTVRIKMRLIYRSSLPSTIGANEPFTGFDSNGDPLLASGWTAIAPKNDPIYTVPNSTDPETPGGNAFPAFSFDEFGLPNADNANMTLGIALYTLDNLSNVSPEDSLLIDSISLVPNRFAVQTNPQTFDQVTQECQFYYEKSYKSGTLPGNATVHGALFQQLPLTHTGGVFSGDILRRHAFTVNFKTIKRADPSLTFYSPSTAADSMRLQINRGAAQPTAVSGSNPSDVNISTYTQHSVSTKNVVYFSNDTSIVMQVSFNDVDEGLMIFHYVADARLGI